MVGDPSGPGDAAVRRGFTLTMTVGVVGLVVALLAQLGGAGVRRALDGHAVLWPQQWTFFTRLDAEVLVAYRRDPSGALLPVSERARWGERLGGVRRVRADQAAELRRLAMRVPDAWWAWCDGAPVSECVATAPAVPFRTTSDGSAPWWCGSMVIGVEGPPAVGADRTARPQRVARAAAAVEVTCAAREPAARG